MRYLQILILAGSVLLASESSVTAQPVLSADEFVAALRGPVTPVDIQVKEIQEQALERMKKPGKPQDRAPLVEELEKLPQLALDIQFNSDSPIVRPESYRMLGRLADALYHPYLLDRKFLIAVHIEATGKRLNNLELSQRRASAIRDILVTTFRVAPQRLVALGLGEEQLQDRARPNAPSNRRIQVILIGKR
jgi:outer membrane protein OmpA-like peptidoglycan-associated protein